MKKSEETIDALGLWNMGDGSFHSLLSPSAAKAIIRKAWKEGIRAFDSAFSYREADSLLYSALREMNAERCDYAIWSKVMAVPTLERKALSSLKRLGTDHFDILMLHWPTKDENLFPALKTLERMKDEGKTIEIGVSNFPLPLLEKVSRDFQLSYHERPLSLIWTREWEEERKLSLKTIAYGPGGLGLLGGKYSSQTPPQDRRQDNEAFKSEYFPILIDKMKEIALKHSLTLYETAYSFVYSMNPWAIVRGIGKAENTKIRKSILDKEDMNSLSSLSSLIVSTYSKDNIFAHSWS